MRTWLFNPFKFVAGNKALLLGMGAMIITALFCFVEKVHLDGVIDLHQGRETAGYVYFAEPVIDWLCFVLPLYVFGRILSGSAIRFIDLAGTGALARYPIFFGALVMLMSPRNMDNPETLVHALQTSPQTIARLVYMALLLIPFTVWTVALMYNAYSVSTNLKGTKAVLSFIASFLIAEIVSKVIIYHIATFIGNFH